MKGKKGNNDGFPSIPGIIARYSALGLTNEQMAANPVWVDKTGNGHDLQLKNFSWGGMSGVGGYEMNFNLWRNNVLSIPDISMSTTTTSVSVSVGNSTYNNNLIYIHINNWDINKNHWLKVTSTYEDGDLAFVFYNNSNTKKIGLPANGYVNILAYPEFKGSYTYISTTSNKQGSFTIEQIPEYEGYLVTDGVDDKAVSKQFKFGENFTVILDFKFPVKKIAYCGFDLSSKVRIQNLQGSGVYVVLKGNRTLIPSNVVRAVTSEGKVYDENWNEYNIVPGNISSNYTMVNLGFDGSNQFAESATKLAGIYSSTLSKDDCIKAYNYLQSLKAK